MNSPPPTNQINDLLKEAFTLHKQGKLEAALKILQQILAVDPNNFSALHGMGALLGQLGRYEEALRFLTAGVAVQPNDFAVHYNRGNTLQQLKRYDEALTSYDKTLALKPDFADAHNNRGNTLRELRRYDEALACFDKTLALRPGLADVYVNRGNTLRDINRYQDALASYGQAISLKPDYADTYNNRGIALKHLKRYAEALINYDRAISLKPDYASPYYNRGILLQSTNYHEDALHDFNKAISLDRNCPHAHGYRLAAEMHIGLWDEFERHVQELIALIDQGVLASVPFPLLAIPASPAILQKCASQLVADEYLPANQVLWRGEHYGHDRIRVGYFSADYRNHAMAYVLAELFEKHDRDRFEVFAFSFGPDPQDEMRARMVKAFDHFFDLSGHSDWEIAALAREREIDIAIDLMGFTTDARPGIFAHRPAPIQAGYLGYPGTMGAPFIDYIIADAVVIPKEQFAYYSEKVVRLPHSYQVNDSRRRIADTVPARSALGLPEIGFVFCCFNNNYKITPDVFTIWMRLLTKVAGSVLWLVEGNAAIQRNLLKEAQKSNIGPERLVFAPRIGLEEHLARQRQADLFLDTFYYNAHATASGALWAGLPVLTCLGDTFAGRVGASLLYALGLPELVTRSHDEYESLALRLATHPDDLAALREKLAGNRLTRPLFDSSLFTRHIESAYTTMWQRTQQGLAPDHIDVDP